jgi:hypothetical protein
MLPAAVGRALATYRALLAEHGMSWGAPPIPYVRIASHSRFTGDEEFFTAAERRVRAEHPGATEAEHETLVRELDFDEVLRDVVGDDPPMGWRRCGWPMTVTGCGERSARSSTTGPCR